MFLNDPQVDDYGNEYYSTQILVPKSEKEFCEKLKKTINTVGKSGWQNFKFVEGGAFKILLRDGDKELETGKQTAPHFAGHYFFNAKCYQQPGLMAKKGGKKVLITDPVERKEIMVSGYHFVFSLLIKCFDNEGSKGVNCLLNNVFFVKKDDRLDGSSNAEDDFGEMDIESEEVEESAPSSYDDGFSEDGDDGFLDGIDE